VTPDLLLVESSTEKEADCFIDFSPPSEAFKSDFDLLLVLILGRSAGWIPGITPD
jgi:hypothetical protein